MSKVTSSFSSPFFNSISYIFPAAVSDSSNPSMVYPANYSPKGIYKGLLFLTNSVTYFPLYKVGNMQFIGSESNSAKNFICEMIE